MNYTPSPGRAQGLPPLHLDWKSRAHVQSATEAGREIIENILAGGCPCCREAAVTASLVRRRNAAGVLSVALQCDNCGKSLGSRIKREDHPKWEEYPAWDDDLSRRYWDAQSAETSRRLAAQQAAWAAAAEERKREYHQWLETSPAWQRLRTLVLNRAGFVCEACMSRKAVQVHHSHYQNGKAPPGWVLRAVCGTCHDRLHNEDDEWRGA